MIRGSRSAAPSASKTALVFVKRLRSEQDRGRFFAHFIPVAITFRYILRATRRLPLRCTRSRTSYCRSILGRAPSRPRRIDREVLETGIRTGNATRRAAIGASPAEMTHHPEPDPPHCLIAADCIDGWRRSRHRCCLYTMSSGRK